MGLSLLRLSGPLVTFAFSSASNGGVNTNQFLDPAAPDQAPQATEAVAQRVAGVNCRIWSLVGSYNVAGTQSSVMTARINGVSQASTATTVGAVAGAVVTVLTTAINMVKTDLLSVLFKFSVADATASLPQAQIVAVVSNSL